MRKNKLIVISWLVLLLVFGIYSQALASDTVIGIKLEVFDKDLRALQPTDNLMAGDEIYLDISLNCNGAAADEYITGYSITVDYRGCRGFLERVTSDGKDPSIENEFAELTRGAEKIVNGMPAVTPMVLSNGYGFIVAANVQPSGKLLNSVLDSAYKPFIRYYFKAKAAMSVSELEFIVCRTQIPSLKDPITGVEPYTQTSLYGRIGSGISDTIYYNFTETNFPDLPIIYYTVSFDTDGGTSVPSQSVRSGNKAFKPADPFKSGFSFSGWFKDSDKTIAYTFNEAVTANITLYAKWAVHTEGPYLITFDSKGGSSVPSQTVAFGGKAAKPLNPTRTGFNFVGWYEDEDCTILYNFDEPVTKNMLLYAKWDINEYTVTFVSKGGSDVVEKTVEHGSKVEEPDEPTLKGHRFAGWYTDEDYEDEYEFSTLVTGSFTLYAKWNIIPFSAYFNAPAKIYVREGNKVDYVVSVSNIGGDGSNLFIIEADFDSEYLNFEGYNFSLEINAYSPAQREFSFDDNGKLSLTMFFTRSMVLLKADEETSLAIFHFSLKDSAIPVKAVIESFLSKVTAYIFYDVLPTPVDAVIMKPGAPVAVLISPLDLEEEELDKTTIEWLILHHLYKTGAADDWDDIKKYDLNGNNMIDLADIVALWSLIDK